MKIAFYHELHKGGARRGTNEFAKQLKNRGHQVDLYTIDKRSDEKEFYTNIYGYRFVPKIWRGNNWKIRLYKDTIELFELYKLNRKIAKVINKKKYDACYLAASFFLESPFILNHLTVPTFFYCNDPYYRIIYERDLFNKDKLPFYKIWYENLNRIIRKYLDKNNISKAKYIIAISNYVKISFFNIYKIHSEIIYYGVHEKYFAPRNDHKLYDILYIGSRDFLDGYPLFKKVLDNLKLDLKIRAVLFEEEWLSDKDLLETYQASKILVATAFREPLGLVPLEAMACGVPVIAVNEGGHKETIINGKTGYLVGKDPKEIASKIDLLLSDKTLYKKMSVSARENVIKNWSWEKRGAELEALLVRKLKASRE